MTLHDILKVNGLAEDAITKIFAAMKENSIFTAGEENLDVRYKKLKGDNDSNVAKLAEANTLIEQLKATNSGNEALQAKITDYEGTIANLNKQLEQTKIDNAIQVALLSEKALDVDYLTYKLKEKGEIKLDEKGNIKGWDNMLSGLKTQFPTQFENGKRKEVKDNPLPTDDDNKETVSKEDFSKMGYKERLELLKNNPEQYEKLTGKENN